MRRHLLAVVLVAVAAALLPTAAARPKKATATPSESPDDETLRQAQEALAQSRAALHKGDAVATYRRAAESFRLVPSPDALFLLGRAALLEKRPLEAQDLMRRYLADPTLESAPDSPEQREAQRLSELPRDRSAKLNILGDRGTLVNLDGRLVGALPLSRPLLISVTEHKVELLRGDRRIEEQVRVPIGRLGELRPDMKTRAMLLSVLPGVVVLDQYLGFGQVEQRRLAQAVEEAVQAERLSPLSRELALEAAGEPEPGPCADERRCLLALAEKCEADYLLRVQVRKQAADWQLEMELFDVAVHEPAARGATPCAGCSLEQAQKSLATLFAPLYGKANGRPRGTLEVRSEPSDAELLLDGQRLGKTPYTAAVWTGARELVLRKKDHRDERLQVRINDGETAKLEARLQPLEKPAPPPAPRVEPRFELRRDRRPTWRLAVGAGALGAGVLMIGLGSSAISFHGRCATDVPDGSICPSLFNTLSPALGLLTVGPLLAITGIAFLARPGPLRRVRVDVR
jgi:hypothetical protein